MTHVDYPHEPGRLYDCPACEAECHCTGDPGHTPCVYCAELMTDDELPTDPFRGHPDYAGEDWQRS